MISIKNNNPDILYFIFTSSMFFAIFLSPLFSGLLLSVYFIALKKSSFNVFDAFVPAVLIATFASIIDYNGFTVGDVNRYYEDFALGSQFNNFDKSLARFKLFQWISFTIINRYDLSIKLYTLFGVFLALFSFSYVFVYVYRKLDLQRKYKSNLIYFLLLITLIPFDVIYSFEYITAVAILFFSFVVYYDSKFKVLLGSVISLSMHNGVLLPLCILLSLYFFKNKKKLLVVAFYLSFFVIFIYGAKASSTTFLSYTAYKFYSYYSDFNFDLSLSIVSFIYIVSFLFVINFYNKINRACINESILLDFMKVLLCISPLLISNSVFSQRFIIFLAPVFLILFYRYFVYSKNTIHKFTIFCILMLTNLSYANLLVINSLVTYVHVGDYSGSFLVTNIMELIAYYE